MRAIKDNLAGILFGVLVLFLNILLIFNSYALTDGWWETYAWLMSMGFKPYKDFYMAFPPLIPMLQMNVLDNLGDYLVAVRTVGMFSIIIEIIVLYKVIRLVTNRLPALFGVAVSYGLIYANGNYLVSDYHNYVSILNGVVLFNLIKYVRKSYCNLFDRNVIAVGLALGFLILIKQNNAVFLALGSVLCIHFRNIKTKQYSRLLIDTAVSVLCASTPLLLAYYTFGVDWFVPYFNNDSKGSAATVFFRFILESSIRKQILVSILLASLALIASRKFGDRKVFNYKVNEWIPTLFIPAFAILFVLKGELAISVFALTWLLYRTGMARESNSAVANFIIMTILVYCGTQSAGLNFVSLEYPIALAFAELYSRVQGIWKIRFRYIFFVPCAALMLIVAPKVFKNIGYTWWGYSAGNIIAPKGTIDNFEYFKYVRTDQLTANIIKDVYSLKSKIRDDQSVFSYPSIPIFYKLLDKIPETPPVLWFDVVSDKAVYSALSLLESKNPDYILWLRPSADVYIGHAFLRNKRPAQMLIDSFITKGLTSGEYTLLKSYFILNDHDQLIIDVKGCPSTEVARIHDFCNKDIFCNTAYEEKIVIDKVQIDKLPKLDNLYCAGFNVPIFYIISKSTFKEIL